MTDIAAFLLASQHTRGGIGGSPGQAPHLATTYAGVAAAVTAGPEALAVIDRQTTLQFLRARCVSKSAGGGFEVCEGKIEWITIINMDWSTLQASMTLSLESLPIHMIAFLHSIPCHQIGSAPTESFMTQIWAKWSSMAFLLQLCLLNCMHKRAG